MRQTSSKSITKRNGANLNLNLMKFPPGFFSNDHQKILDGKMAKKGKNNFKKCKDTLTSIFSG
jgi:hypothetical protein